MKHFVYKTTCLVTGMYYVGAHSTWNVDDSYLESGRKLHESLRQFGREQHVREIICSCKERDELMLKELELVNKLLNDQLCLNVVIGCSSFRGSEKLRQAVVVSNRTRLVDETTREKIRCVSTGRKHSPETKRQLGELRRGRTLTPKEKACMSDALRAAWKCRKSEAGAAQ